MEQVNGTDCYVIDAKTRRGQYTIWLNPEKGYNFSRATVVRQTGDLIWHKSRLGADSVNKFSIENTQFTQVDGVWVPVTAKMEYDYKLPDGGHVQHNKDVELISILIDPDHDALDSFSVDDIKDGAKAIIRGVRGVDCTWRDGKVVDKNGWEVDLDKLNTKNRNPKK